MAITSILLVALGMAFSTQSEILGRTGDAHATFTPAAAALQRVRDELASAVQNPAGLTATPAYAVSASFLTFRPPEGYIDPSDPSYATLKAQGRVSSNNILYASYAKTITYDGATRTLNLVVAGTPPAGMKTSEVLARDVTSFAFFDGESQAVTPIDATVNSWVIGARITIRRVSMAPGAKGANVDSSVAGQALSTKVRLVPESLLNSQSKPIVGP